MDVHPTKNGMYRYWSIAICPCSLALSWWHVADPDRNHAMTARQWRPNSSPLNPRIQHRWYQGGIQIPFSRSPKRYPGVESAKKKQFEALWSTSKHRNFHNSRASVHALVFHKPLSPGFLWVPWVSRGTKKGRILHRERSTKAVKMSWAGSQLDWPSGFFQISSWRSRWFAEALTNGHWWWWWWLLLLLLLSLWLWLLVIIVIMIHDNHL